MANVAARADEMRDGNAVENLRNRNPIDFLRRRADALSQRSAELRRLAESCRFGIDPRTVNKIMKFSVPPGYVRKKPPRKPKLDPFIPVIEGILGDDKSRRGSSSIPPSGFSSGYETNTALRAASRS